MRERPTVRVLLLDPKDRLLMIRGRATHDPSAPSVWFPVGGGARSGETLAETALREVREESGLAAVELGPVVWRGETILTLSDGVPTRLVEQYVVARCEGGEPDRSGWDAVEQALCDDIRWWTVEELRRTRERLHPVSLVELLPPILSGDYPPEPVRISAAAETDERVAGQ